MKKIVLIASMLISAFVLTSCASEKAASEQPVSAGSSATQVSSASVHHHDYKGEQK